MSTPCTVGPAIGHVGNAEMNRQRFRTFAYYRAQYSDRPNKHGGLISVNRHLQVRGPNWTG